MAASSRMGHMCTTLDFMVVTESALFWMSEQPWSLEVVSGIGQFFSKCSGDSSHAIKGDY